MAIYCGKCRTRIVVGDRCTTCGHVNPEPASMSDPFEAKASANVIPPPPVPPSGPPAAAGSKTGLYIGLGLLVAAIVGIVVFVGSRGSDDSPIILEYSVEVFTSDYCDDFYMTGYSDVPYSEVVVVDGEGDVLGTSTLDGGVDTDNSCVFSTTFEIERSSTGVYRVTSGKSTRGFVNYRDSDIRNGRLVADVSLGE